MRHFWTLLIFLCVLPVSVSSCGDGGDTESDRLQMGVLPPQTPELIAAEFEVYRRNHPEMDEARARAEFDIIQKMSTKFSDPQVAAWAERKALALRWVKVRIEDLVSEKEVSDEMIKEAIDSYAFNSGHPSLVTASHILMRKDEVSTPEERHMAMESVRQRLMNLSEISDDDLRREAVRLTHAGFRVDMNADLTFPAHAINSFMGSQSNYMAVVQPFADAAFALSADQPLSEVTETDYGYHLILFKSRTEEQKAQLPQDRKFIVNQIIKAGRTQASKQFIGQLINNLSAQNLLSIDQERLGELSGLKQADE